MENKILDAALNVSSAAEVYSESVIATTVAFEANQCHVIENKITGGLGLRVVWNGKIGFSSATNPERIDELLEAAVATARFGQPAGFELPPGQVLPAPLIAHSRISLLPAERMKLVGDHVIELC
jgi:PmbA protein